MLWVLLAAVVVGWAFRKVAVRVHDRWFNWREQQEEKCLLRMRKNSWRQIMEVSRR